jgi:hypothetical protein
LPSSRSSRLRDQCGSGSVLERGNGDFDMSDRHEQTPMLRAQRGEYFRDPAHLSEQ